MFTIVKESAILKKILRILKSLGALFLNPVNEIKSIHNRQLPFFKLLFNYLLPLVVIHIIIAILHPLLQCQPLKLYPLFLIKIAVFYIVQPLLLLYISSAVIRPISRMYEGNFKINNIRTVIVISVVPYFLGRSFSIIHPELYYLEFIGFYGLLLLWHSSTIVLKIKETKKVAFVFLSTVIILGVDMFTSMLIDIFSKMLSFSYNYFIP